ncbi:MAG: hypothetical protein KGJ19_06100 [Betaproteobacteria bacterium]|nr:hypothetical protein [Betaproteobacteria bacterium]
MTYLFSVSLNFNLGSKLPSTLSALSGIVCTGNFDGFSYQPYLQRDIKLAQPNFQFEKRQKELAKKKKQEEKRQRKLAEKANKDQPEQPADEGTAA